MKRLALMALVFERPPFLPYPILAATKREALRDAASNERLWDAQLKDRYLLQHQLGRLQRPTLSLWGASDRVFDVSGAQILRSVLQASRVDTLPGMVHLPMMEAPRDTARRYADCLSAVKANPGTTAAKEKWKLRMARKRRHFGGAPLLVSALIPLTTHRMASPCSSRGRYP